MKRSTKIFGIGLSRTGTTSLTNYLNAAGFRIVHYPSKTQMFTIHNDGCTDIPVALCFEALDDSFPNSKFIYTIRDNWIDAVEPYFLRKKGRKYGQWQLKIREGVYGSVDFDREQYARAYEEHDRKVREYFADRPDDLLILNIVGGDSARKLDEFLGIQTGKEFLKSNARIGW